MRDQFRRFESGDFLTAEEVNALSKNVRSFSTGSPRPYTRGVRYSTDLESPTTPFAENIVEVSRRVSEYLYKVRTRFFVEDSDSWETNEAGGPYYMDSSEFEAEYEQGDKVVAYWDKQRHAYVPCTAIGGNKEGGDTMRCGYTCLWVDECCLFLGSIHDFVEIDEEDEEEGYCSPELESSAVWIIADVWTRNESTGEREIDPEKIETILNSTGWVRRISDSHSCEVLYPISVGVWKSWYDYDNGNKVLWDNQDDELRVWEADGDPDVGAEPDIDPIWVDKGDGEDYVIRITFDLPVYEWCSLHDWTECPPEEQPIYAQFSQLALWDVDEEVPPNWLNPLCPEPERICSTLKSIGKVELTWSAWPSSVEPDSLLGRCDFSNYILNENINGYYVGEFTVNTTQPVRYFRCSYDDSVYGDDEIGFYSLDWLTGELRSVYKDTGGGDVIEHRPLDVVSNVRDAGEDRGCFFFNEGEAEEVHYKYQILACCEDKSSGKDWFICLAHVFPDDYPIEGIRGKVIEGTQTGNEWSEFCDNIGVFEFTVPGWGDQPSCDDGAGMWGGGQAEGPNQWWGHKFAGCYNDLKLFEVGDDGCVFCTKAGDQHYSARGFMVLTW